MGNANVALTKLAIGLVGAGAIAGIAGRMAAANPSASTPQTQVARKEDSNVGIGQQPGGLQLAPSTAPAPAAPAPAQTRRTRTRHS